MKNKRTNNPNRDSIKQVLSHSSLKQFYSFVFGSQSHMSLRAAKTGTVSVVVALVPTTPLKFWVSVDRWFIFVEIQQQLHNKTHSQPTIYDKLFCSLTF